MWSANYVNNPYDDYNLMVEILFNDEEVAVITQCNKELELKWFAVNHDVVVPFDWLLGLLLDAKERLLSNQES